MFGARYPIFQAPMAGGVTTPEMAAAVSNAGGLGSLASAYSTPEQITADVARVRALTARPFAVNLFAYEIPPLDRDPGPMLARLAAYHEELGLPAPALPERPGERFAEQAAAVLAARVPVFTFSFGIPPAELLAAFRAGGTHLAGTATTVREAELLAEAGVDAVILQGAEAGAHRGTFDRPFEESMVPTMTLLREAARAVRLPLVAAGGIMDGAGIRAALDAGAAAVQMGTAFIPCPESAASTVYKRAVLSAKEDTTAVTRAFSGRPARGLKNRFMAEVDPHPDEILPYPWQNAATRPLRAAAGRVGRPEFLSLWAGQNARLAREMPAGELVAVLVAEAGLSE